MTLAWILPSVTTMRLIPISTIVASSCCRLVASWVRAAGTRSDSTVSSSRPVRGLSSGRVSLTFFSAASSSTPSFTRTLGARAALRAGVHVDLEDVGELVDQVVAALVLRDVVVAELVEGLGDVGHELAVGLHLLDRGLHDRVEDALDERGDERREVDFPEQSARDRGASLAPWATNLSSPVDELDRCVPRFGVASARPNA